MEYRSLGQTGEQVSAISFGGSSLGGVFHDIDEDEGIRAVHVAVDGGVNLIDTSPYYGMTKAESVLGRALREIKRDRYLISTKCGRYGPNAEDFDFSAERITRSVDESLTRLGLDYVDVLYAHDIEFGSVEQIVDETLPAMERLMAAGKCRWIGISGLPLELLVRVVEARPGMIDLVLSYCHFTLSDRALLEALPTFEKYGVGVVNASPTGMGLLTSRAAPVWHPAPEALVVACKKAAGYCSERGEDLVKLAVQFAVQDERVPTTLVGTADPAEMAANLAWADEPMDKGLLAEVEAILSPVMGMTWTSGIEENH